MNCSYTSRDELYFMYMDDGFDDTRTHDGNGNRTAFDVSGTRSLDYVYDERDQLAMIDYAPVTDTTFPYNAFGNVTASSGTWREAQVSPERLARARVG